jgi:hypothetical protein
MFCFAYSGRLQCSHAYCSNFAEARGLCIKHGYKQPTCSMDGCNNQSDTHGLCKQHGARHCCNDINYTKNVLKHNMCQSHYSLTNKSSTVTNKSSTVSTTDPSTKSSTVTNYLIAVTNQSSTVIVRIFFVDISMLVT